MGFVAESVTLPNYLRIDLKGEFAYTDMLEFVEKIKLTVEDAGREKVLVDCRDLAGTIHESHKFFIGARIAEVFGPRIKSALVMREGTVTKLGENTAVNRGARLLVTDSESEALEWLGT